MIKTPLGLQDLRQRIYIKAKAEPSWPNSAGVSAGRGGVGHGFTGRSVSSRTTAYVPSIRRRKRSQHDRPHNPWSEASRTAECGKPACSVGRGEDWKRRRRPDRAGHSPERGETVRARKAYASTAPVLDPTTPPLQNGSSRTAYNADAHKAGAHKAGAHPRLAAKKVAAANCFEHAPNGNGLVCLNDLHRQVIAPARSLRAPKTARLPTRRDRAAHLRRAG